LLLTYYCLYCFLTLLLLISLSYLMLTYHFPSYLSLVYSLYYYLYYLLITYSYSYSLLVLFLTYYLPYHSSAIYLPPSYSFYHIPYITCSHLSILSLLISLSLFTYYLVFITYHPSPYFTSIPV
ncbi:uncharacterized protein VICG_00617, partial [Vittaforma corneae ATCC 50505]